MVGYCRTVDKGRDHRRSFGTVVLKIKVVIREGA